MPGQTNGDTQNGEQPPPALWLLVSAHPADESLFFAPTLRSLLRTRTATGAPPPQVRILCLSHKENYDGTIGSVRTEELYEAASVLGLLDDGAVVGVGEGEGELSGGGGPRRGADGKLLKKKELSWVLSDDDDDDDDDGDGDPSDEPVKVKIDEATEKQIEKPKRRLRQPTVVMAKPGDHKLPAAVKFDDGAADRESNKPPRKLRQPTVITGKRGHSPLPVSPLSADNRDEEEPMKRRRQAVVTVLDNEKMIGGKDEVWEADDVAGAVLDHVCKTLPALLADDKGWWVVEPEKAAKPSRPSKIGDQVTNVGVNILTFGKDGPNCNHVHTNHGVKHLLSKYWRPEEGEYESPTARPTTISLLRRIEAEPSESATEGGNISGTAKDSIRVKIRAFSLRSVSNPLIRDFAPPLEFLPWVLRTVWSVVFFLIGGHVWMCKISSDDTVPSVFRTFEPWRIRKAVAAHESQFSFKRGISVLFSRYTYVNEFDEIKADETNKSILSGALASVVTFLIYFGPWIIIASIIEPHEALRYKDLIVAYFHEV